MAAEVVTVTMSLTSVLVRRTVGLSSFHHLPKSSPIKNTKAASPELTSSYPGSSLERLANRTGAVLVRSSSNSRGETLELAEAVPFGPQPFDDAG